jgi:hypothetical protein
MAPTACLGAFPTAPLRAASQSHLQRPHGAPPQDYRLSLQAAVGRPRSRCEDHCGDGGEDPSGTTPFGRSSNITRPATVGAQELRT